MIWNIVVGLARLAIDLALVWMLFGRPGKRGSAKTLSDGRTEFAPDWIGLWAYPLTFAYVVGMAARHLVQAHGGIGDYISKAVSGVIALYVLLSFPGTVVTANDGLETVYWFRMNKRIRWEDVAKIEADKKNTLFSIIAITGIDGTRIVHSWLLADQLRLLLEIQKHCGEDLPPNFPRAPVDSL